MVVVVCFGTDGADAERGEAAASSPPTMRVRPQHYTGDNPPPLSRPVVLREWVAKLARAIEDRCTIGGSAMLHSHGGSSSPNRVEKKYKYIWISEPKGEKLNKKYNTVYDFFQKNLLLILLFDTDCSP